MSENRYMERKRAILKKFGVRMFYWLCFIVIFNLLLGSERFWTITDYVLSSLPTTGFILFTVFIIFMGDFREITKSPRIRVTDTLLVIRYGKPILNWEQISKIHLRDDTLEISLKGESRFFSTLNESIEDIMKRSDLLNDLKKRCSERNIPITGISPLHTHSLDKY